MLTSRSTLFFLALVLPGCGSFDLGLPTVPTVPVQPCTEADKWDIAGFDGYDVGAGGVVLFSVGESRQLVTSPGAEFVDCDAAVASVRWTSSNSRVASFEPGTRVAWLTARSTGETEIRADVTLTTGATRAAFLSIFLPSSGQSAHTIRVVPAPVPPAGRKIIFSRTVTLEPSPGTAGPYAIRQAFDVPAAGTLDMVVDWQSTNNQITAHVCPGVVSGTAGCVPVIDGDFDPPPFVNDTPL